eukprot:Sdes_comp9228_c0_seq1m711
MSSVRVAVRIRPLNNREKSTQKSDSSSFSKSPIFTIHHHANQISIHPPNFASSSSLSPPTSVASPIAPISPSTRILKAAKSPKEIAPSFAGSRNVSRNSSPFTQSMEKSFTFDMIFDSTDPSQPYFSSQADVYEGVGADVVSAAFEGYNCCIFAYGQTG